MHNEKSFIIPESVNVNARSSDTQEDEDQFDSDDENMSLAVTMTLANELNLLVSFINLYRDFDDSMGGKPLFPTLDNP